MAMRQARAASSPLRAPRICLRRSVPLAKPGDPGPSTILYRRFSTLPTPRNFRHGDARSGQVGKDAAVTEPIRGKSAPTETEDFFTEIEEPELHLQAIEEDHLAAEDEGMDDDHHTSPRISFPHSSDTRDFAEYASELRRRKRKDEVKRLQRGNAFIDHLIVQVSGGVGGSGAAAFSRQASGALGPASGGNGGQGGSVYLATSPDLTSLVSLRSMYKGGRGLNGQGDIKHGRRGEDVMIEVPVGTVVREIGRRGPEAEVLEAEEAAGLDKEAKVKARQERRFLRHPGSRGKVFSEQEEKAKYKAAERMLREANRAYTRTPDFDAEPPVVLDIAEEIRQPVLLAKGGHGGLGNPFFSFGQLRESALASRGLAPTMHTFEFELKLLADVGLVGFPNVGKSTLLRGLTGRKAEVAGYEFTTLNPQIGVVRVFEDGSFGGAQGEGGMIEDTAEERKRDTEARLRGEYRQVRSSAEKHEGGIPEVNRFTISDNPGLLPLAHQDVGLGHSFLRSIERCLVLAYVLDLSGSSPEHQLLSLRNELEAYKPGLAGKASIVVLNKADQVDEQAGRERMAAVREALRSMAPKGEVEVVTLSGKFGLGLKGLVKALSGKVSMAREEKEAQRLVTNQAA